MEVRCKVTGCSHRFRWWDAELCPTLYHPDMQLDDESDDDTSHNSSSIAENIDRAPERGRGKKGKGRARRQKKRPAKKKGGPGADMHGHEPFADPRNQMMLACSDKFMKRSKMLVPSAKITRVQELFREWQQNAPEDKIIGKGNTIL